MIANESKCILPGLGKSTLINSLFLTDLYPDRVVPTAAEKIERKTLKLDASTVSLSYFMANANFIAN